MNNEIAKVMKESMVILLEIKRIDAKYKRLDFSVLVNNSRSKNKDKRNYFNTTFRRQVITKKRTATRKKLTKYSTPPKGSALLQ